ncbi:hypothetical protein Tco_0975030 [Tanacetum coccineum]|uniref:Uncharacterized protein n=1 Tax=Tanacetum coccineum TaxID=301880 RepID=A0ABQ5EDA8_9ASTR
MHVYPVVTAMYACLSYLVGLRLLVKVRSCLIGVVLLVKDCRMINLSMEYLVKVSKRRAFWSLNKDILKITILKTNTPYPSRKIRRICACTHQRPQGIKLNTPYPEDQYAVLELWNQYNILEDIKCGPYSKKSPICHSEHSTVTYTSVSIPVEDDSDIGSPGVDGPPIIGGGVINKKGGWLLGKKEKKRGRKGG